ncbi:hypothetical protein [Streptomyces sp. NPDC002640]
MTTRSCSPCYLCAVMPIIGRSVEQERAARRVVSVSGVTMAG